MKSVMVWVLAALNLALLAVVVDQHTKDRTANAAPGRVGQVIAVPGDLAGASSGVIFLLDTTNRSLSAISYDSTTNRVASMPALDIQRILDNAGAVTPPRRGK